MNTELSLAARPRLVKCGLVEHGLHGREEYQLPAMWCLHLYFYEVRIEVRGKSYRILPGSLTLIPPGTRIVYHYSPRRHRHFFVHFTTPSKRSPAATLPLCQHLPQAKDELLDRLENIQRIRTHNTLHAEIALWALLWDLAESADRTGSAPSETPLSRRIEELIEAGLPGQIGVQHLAREVGISSTHVNRTVKARHGLTTVQLIRKRRLQRAYHLLLHSTMPIKLLAAECGVGDLQQFNKLMRREYGESPRVLRKLHQPNPTWASDRQ